MPRSDMYANAVITWKESLQGLKDKALFTVHSFLYENMSLLRKPLEKVDTQLTIEFKPHELFEIILDPSLEPLVCQQEKEKEKQEKQENKRASIMDKKTDKDKKDKKTEKEKKKQERKEKKEQKEKEKKEKGKDKDKDKDSSSSAKKKFARWL